MIDHILSRLFPEQLSKRERERLQALRTALQADEELLSKLCAQRNEDRKRVDGKTEARSWGKSFPWLLWIIVLILITGATVYLTIILHSK